MVKLHSLQAWFLKCGNAYMSDGDEDARERRELDLAIKLSLEREESLKNRMEGGEPDEEYFAELDLRTASDDEVVEEAVRRDSSSERWPIDE